MWVVLFKLYGLYDRDLKRVSHSTVDDVPWLFHGVVIGTLLTWLLFKGLPPGRLPFLAILTFGMLVPNAKAGVINQTFSGSFPGTISGTLPSSDTALEEAIAITAPSDLTAYTTSYAAGGFQPNITLFNPAGIAIANQSPQPPMGASILIPALIVVVVGGLGSLKGSLVGSLLIGQAETFGKVWLPGVSMAMIYFVMAGVVLLRPQGLFGRPLR